MNAQPDSDPDPAGANRDRIAAFYDAFARRDADTMAAAYAPDGHFKDPAFGDLTGEQAGAMWRMLAGRAKDLEIELVEHDADAHEGSARWIAHYTFATTGRPVVNDVRASFKFAPDGKIAEHIDSFSFYAWSRQALGPAGLLLGWSPILHALFTRRARAELQSFIAQERG